MKVFLDNGSLNSSAGELHAAIARARQEAITRGTYVSIGALDGVHWSTGYQIFVNPLNSTSYNASDHVGTSGTSVVTAAIVAVGMPTAWGNVSWPSTTSDSKAAVSLYTFSSQGRPYIPGGGPAFPSTASRVQMCTPAMKCKEIWVDTMGRIEVLSF
jgi:Tfp pilus assembly protein FimT